MNPAVFVGLCPKKSAKKMGVNVNAWQAVRAKLGKAELVVVSKHQALADVQTLYALGQRAFAENRLPSLLEKQQALPKDIAWHFIGHLQSNKIKDLIGKVSLIHSVDRLSILENINKEAEKKGLCVSVLLQFHIAQEESKQGFDPAQMANFSADYFASLKHVSLAGVMGMATLTADKAQVRREFQTLKNTFDALKRAFFQNIPAFKHISMGMSQDYDIALAECANILRIGSLFFT
jgi:PLP dependent protein